MYPTAHVCKADREGFRAEGLRAADTYDSPKSTYEPYFAGAIHEADMWTN